MFFHIHTPTPLRGFGACVARPSSTPWVGMTTVCPPNVVYKIITASHAMLQCLTLQTSRHHSKVSRQKITSHFLFHGRTSLSCATYSHTKMRKFLKNFSVDLVCLLTGRCSTQPLKNAAAKQVNAHFLTTCNAVRRTCKKLQHCGMLISILQLLKQNSKIVNAQARTTRWRFTSPVAQLLMEKPTFLLTPRDPNCCLHVLHL